MRVHLNIPDPLLLQIDELAEADHVDRTATVCRLLARGVRAELDDGADRGPAVASADQAHDVGATARSLTQREADAAKLPPVELPHPEAKPALGALGGAPEDEQELLRRTLADTQRKRAAAGLDPETGASPDAKATRAAVEGTGPRPMGFLRKATAARRLNPGPAPETPPTKIEPGEH